MTPEILLLMVGALGGFWVGRWWSEIGRGRHDARKAWRGRNSYRNRER